MWVVLEKPCWIGQRSESGGQVNADFLESEGGRSTKSSMQDPQKQFDLGEVKARVYKTPRICKNQKVVIGAGLRTKKIPRGGIILGRPTG